MVLCNYLVSFGLVAKMLKQVHVTTPLETYFFFLGNSFWNLECSLMAVTDKEGTKHNLITFFFSKK